MSRFAVCLALGVLLGCAPLPRAALPGVLPGLVPHLVSFYDFEHPVAGDTSREADLGSSGTVITLVNGGESMRVNDGAHAGSARALQTLQISPARTGNDDWKAGVYDRGGVSSMTAFASVAGITVMGWVKPTGTNPGLNSNTADPTDYFGAVGLFGVLAGDSDGHGVRALLEVIDVSGTLRLAALGRRLDGGNSLVLAADDDWRSLLPHAVWTHLAATFNFDDGTMTLYRNGVPLAATYTSASDQWSVRGAPEPDRTSASRPAGIKIGGSFPQNTAERNPFSGRLDDLMFFNVALSTDEVRQQYLRAGDSD